MKIAVCDDTQSDREQVSEYIRQYANRSTLDIEIDMFSNAESLLFPFKKSVYKIIFLDILLNKMSGVEAAFKIREIDNECVIIFTTTSPDYRAEGFEVGAIHYLIKPVSFEKIEEALKIAEQMNFSHDDTELDIPTFLRTGARSQEKELLLQV